ncbi:MAG TPA: helix-turn-helix transcriptional regulator, partial [Ktedonobacterales bacterium]|nr:helix-turn-helix transcriptional regulator [Ktedonobacterales bacterium]
MDDRPLGELLRAFRLRAELTQQELADISDVSQRDISDLERGARRFPYRHTVNQLAEALHLS